MWVILADRTDPTAWWAKQGLAAHGLESVELLTVEELAGATRWVHTVASDGAWFEARLPDGRVLHSEDLAGALNRIRHLPATVVAPIEPSDRDYVTQELHAFFLSWITAIHGPVLNRATPQGLGGSWRHPSEWARLAGLCGLPHRTYHSGDHLDGLPHPLAGSGPLAIVIGDRVVGDQLAADLEAGCVALARRARTPLLGIRFAWAPEGLEFVGADPVPPLEHGGDDALEALVLALRGQQ